MLSVGSAPLPCWVSAGSPAQLHPSGAAVLTQELSALCSTRDLPRVSTNGMSEHHSFLLLYFFLYSVTEVFSREQNLRFFYFWDKTPVLCLLLGFFGLRVWVSAVASCVSPLFSASSVMSIQVSHA